MPNSMPHPPTASPLTVWPCYGTTRSSGRTHRGRFSATHLAHRVHRFRQVHPLDRHHPAVDRLSNPVEQLSTVRSKRCFVLAASQGLHSLAERVGVGPTRALMNHFNTTVFLRTREVETCVQKHIALGTRKERPHPRGQEEGGFWGLPPRYYRWCKRTGWPVERGPYARSRVSGVRMARGR